MRGDWQQGTGKRCTGIYNWWRSGVVSKGMNRVVRIYEEVIDEKIRERERERARRLDLEGHQNECVGGQREHH